MSATSDGYDLLAQIPAGYEYQPAIEDALYAAWAANGYQPLSSAQALTAVEAVAGPQPQPLSSLAQMPWLEIAAPLVMNGWPAGLSIAPSDAPWRLLDPAGRPLLNPGGLPLLDARGNYGV